MAGQLLSINVVRKEAVRGREVVIWDEMSSLRHSEKLEVVARSPKSAIDQLSISGGEILNPVELTRLTPKVSVSLKAEPAEPELLSLWTILRVKLTSIDEHWALSID